MDAMSQLDTANGGGVLKAFMLHKCSSNILERVSSIRKTGQANWVAESLPNVTSLTGRFLPNFFKVRLKQSQWWF